MEEYSALNQEEKNTKALKAWCQWKEVCSILGCDRENKGILVKEVANAFIAKVSRVFMNCPTLADSLLSEIGQSPEDIANEFDIGIIEKANTELFDRDDVGRGKVARKPLDYKNHVWLMMEQSSDPPLMVIRGLLVGPRGYVNAIVENWLEEKGWRYSTRKNSQTGGRTDIWYRPSSSSASNGKETGEWGEDDKEGPESFSGELVVGKNGHLRIPALATPEVVMESPVPVEGDQVEFWLDEIDYKGEFENVLDVADAAILVGLAYGLTITTDEKLLSVSGLKKSAISKRAKGLDKFWERLPPDVMEGLESGGHGVDTALFDAVRAQLMDAPGGAEFLKYAEGTATHKKPPKALSRFLPGFSGKSFFEQ